MERKYTAFISYRHKPLDIQVAQKLHTMIERFRVPKALRKNGEKSLGKVFRDREELPLSNNLTKDIYDALDHSAFLIVVCTPDTPQSLWCQREIQYFISRHGRERVLTVLAAGTPEESIPEQITTVYAEDGKTVLERLEPLCAFLVSDSEKQIFKKLKDEFLRLVAAILNCPYDDLKKRQQRYRVRRRRLITAGIGAVLLTIFAILIRWNLDVSQKNQEISQLNDQIQLQLRQTQLNESQALALLSESQLEDGLRGDAKESALRALEGDRPYYAPAEAALTAAAHVYEGDRYYYAAKLQLDTHVEQVVLSGDGRYAVAEDANHNGTCMDLTTGQILWQSKPIDMDWDTSQITRDGKHLLTLGDQALRIYDLATGEELRVLSHPETQVQALSADGKTLVYGHKTKTFTPRMTIEVLDVESGEVLCAYDLDTSYNDIIFSADDRYCLLIPKDKAHAPLFLCCETGQLQPADLTGSMVAACAIPEVSFAFLTLNAAGEYAYEICAPDGTRLCSLRAGEDFASQVRFLLADDQWIYAIRQDGQIQIVHQDAGVMFDDSCVSTDVLTTMNETNLLDLEKPTVFLDDRGDLVAVNREDSIHRLRFAQGEWRGASLGFLHYYDVPGVEAAQLCRTDAYGETMEYQKAFVNPNGSPAICLASKEDDSFLIFLRYTPTTAEDISHVVPGGCTEENTRQYLQEKYGHESLGDLDYNTKTQTLSWLDEAGNTVAVDSPLYVTNGSYDDPYENNGLFAVLSRKYSKDPESADGFAVYDHGKAQWKWLQPAAEHDSFSTACIADEHPWLAAAYDEGHMLRITDLETGAEIADLKLHSADISDLRFVCGDRYLLAVEMLEQAVILVDTAGWQVVGKFPTRLTQYTYLGETASAALNAEGTRLYIGNLLALQQGLIIDTETWTLMAQVPYMACYDPETEQVICMDPYEGRLLAYPAYDTQTLIELAVQ